MGEADTQLPQRFAPVVLALEHALAADALADVPLEEMLQRFGEAARAGGLSIARTFIAWRTLNPLFISQNVTWQVGKGARTERYRHGEGMNTPEFRRSPMRYVLENGVVFYRCRLADTPGQRPFPFFDELADHGFTDYVSMLVGFGGSSDTQSVGAGVLITMCSDAADGFSDDEVAAIDRVKIMLALAARSTIQTDMRDSLARTYLGRTAGRKVLSGQITRGGGESVEAVIWYCDLRNSTELCERMGVEAYIPFLNAYFSVVGGPVTDAGGEILDFIGDAVLAIFPRDRAGAQSALKATWEAVAALRAFQKEHCAVLGGCEHVADLAGIAIDTGRVVYGNIGTEDRLTFSVIGPTVNRVARIERLTKTLRQPVLATRAIADAVEADWRSCGAFTLDGFTIPQELLALSDPGADAG